MNKNKRALCTMLALSMLLSLAACGRGGSGKKGGEAAADYVYRSEFTTVDSSDGSRYEPRIFTSDGVYAASYEKIGERALREGETLSYEGQLDVYGPALYFIANDGAVKKLDAYRSLPAPEDTENRTGYSSGCDLMGIALNEDGGLSTVESTYANWFDGSPRQLNADINGDRWRYERSYYLRTLAADGSEIRSVLISFELDEGQDISFPNLSRDGRGNFLAASGSTLIAVSPDGSIAYVIDCGDLVSGVIRLRDGRVCAVVWGSSGLTLHPIDADKAALGEGIVLPPNTHNLLSGGGDYDLFWRSGSFLYGMRLASGESEQILNWINCDINGDKISALNISADGTITGVLDGARRTELFRLYKIPTASLPEKKTLTLAVMYLEYDMSDLIIDFNRHNDKVRIELRDYSEYNTEKDFSAGLTKLNTEIMSGRMPDLLSLNALPFSQLAGKGLLADLYPYLDADKELGREDLFPTVLKAMEVSGGLYRICPSFTVHSLIGAASVVGDRPGWNYEQFREALASMPDGCTPLEPFTSRDEVLTALVNLDMNDFVDWTTGKCSFDSREFVDLLKFANSFLPDLKWADYDWFENDTAPVRIAQGRQMLLRSMISGVDDVLYNDFMFGGESSYIGWPTNSGVGNMLSLDDHAYAMSASCADKEAGWEFLRTLLLDDYQETVYSLPVVRRVFDERLAEAMEIDYQKDDRGNYVLNASGEKIPIPRASYSTGDGASQDFYALTQEQADKLLELIGTTERVIEENNGILAIVRQGAAAYFAGQKRPEEVARLVQSRINIYVNEHR